MQATYDAAQAPAGNGSDAVLDAVSPSGPNTGAPPAGQALTKEQRDERARTGRQLAALERQVQEANARAEAAMRAAQQTAQSDYENKMRAWNEYLAGLTPEQRAQAETQADLQDIKRELAAQRTQPRSTGYTQQTQQNRPQSVRLTPAEIEARQAEIVAEVSDAYGVALSGREDGIDASNETAYRASLKAVASQMRAAQSNRPPATGQPLNARPVMGAQSVTSEQIADSLWTKGFPADRRKKLAEMRDIAARQAGVA